MGKEGFLTAKAIGNRIKAKGLQKLKWYCQLCEKQCRDENGFKCHMKSESHIRQIKIFAENPDAHISHYSKMFEKGFIDQLFRFHGTKNVLANRIYNEYIAHKEHIHMNATRWSTLAEFVKYLGRESICVVEETERGWWVKYIDRDPNLIARQNAALNRSAEDIDDAKREDEQVLEQQRIARKRAALECRDEEGVDESDMTLTRDSDEKIALGSVSTSKILKRKKLSFQPITLSPGSLGVNRTQLSPLPPAQILSRPLTVMEQIMQEELARKEREQAAQDKTQLFAQANTSQSLEGSDIEAQDASLRKKYSNWLYVGLVVKITNKELEKGMYYGCKGIVMKVVDHFGAQVAVKEKDSTKTMATLLLDQDDLETTVPKQGHKGMIVRGLGRGLLATVMCVQKTEFNCDIQVESGSLKGTTLTARGYDDICRYDKDTVKAKEKEKKKEKKEKGR